MRLPIVVVVLMVLPAAMAGTPDDPEVTDEANDQVPMAGVPVRPETDLLAIWVTEEQAANGTPLVAFYVRLSALAPSGSMERLEYNVFFDHADGRGHVEAWRQNGDAVVAGGYWPTTGGGVNYPCAHSDWEATPAMELDFDDAAATIRFGGA